MITRLTCPKFSSKKGLRALNYIHANQSPFGEICHFDLNMCHLSGSCRSVIKIFSGGLSCWAFRFDFHSHTEHTILCRCWGAPVLQQSAHIYVCLSVPMASAATVFFSLLFSELRHRCSFCPTQHWCTLSHVGHRQTETLGSWWIHHFTSGVKHPQSHLLLHCKLTCALML